MPSTISAGTTAGTAIAIAGDTTGNLAFQTNGTTTAMTIDTSQNVGIGTTSPVAGARLAVVGGGIQLSGGTTSQEGVRVQRISGATTITGINNDNNAYNDIAFYTQASEGVRLTTGNNFQFNSGYGSVATAYGCRAWVNFNGTTSPGTIRGSGNVSSVSRTGTGQYTVNFSNAMPDANYSIIGIANADTRVVSISSLSTSSAAIRTTNSAGALENQSEITVAVFR